MKQNRLLQSLFEVAIGKKDIKFPKSRSLAFKLFNKVSNSNKYANQYLISEQIGNHELLLPLNHRLPWTFKNNPLYSKNLGRISKYITKFHPGGITILDIGANIGDSAFLLRENEDNNTIICIEGNPEYLELLKVNIKQLKHVEIVESFVGSNSENKLAEVISDGKGSSFVKESMDGHSTQYLSLADIIRATCGNDFKNGLLKIDTDGYDCQIIKGNIDCIKIFKPVIFFEYAPAWFPEGKDSQSDIFKFLSDNGYAYFIFYDGIGNYLISCGMNDLDIVSKEMHFYFSCGTRFGDIAAFNEKDEELFIYTVNQEKLFFQNYYLEH